MSMAELLVELRSRGVELTAMGERLRIDAPKGVLTPEIRETLARHKAEILALLESPSPAPRQEIPPECRARYREVAQDSLFDNFPTVDAWLAEHHPGLWQRIRELDRELSRLERKGSTKQEYHVALELFLTHLREAKQEWESTHVLYDNRKGVKLWVQ